MTPQISFIIPLYNEALVFQKLIQRIDALAERMEQTMEVILIDDGSRDETSYLMRQVALNNPRYHCIFLSRNFGHQYALSAGLRYARATEAVMILDGDLQDPPELFFEFYQCYLEGFDVIYGVRRKRKEGALKRMSYFLFYRLLQRISNTPVFLDSGDFSMISRRVTNIINSMPEDNRFLRGLRSWIGFNQKGIPYERDVRAGGEPKYTLAWLIKLAYEGIFNFSVFPIKFLTFSGACCLILAVGYFVITLVRKLVWGDVPVGFTALLFMVILFGGIQLVSIGIIGEYVSRTFLQVKNRPLFIVKERITEGQIIHD
jgi:dolichol-phosphate mannosyltransferase